MPEKTRYQTLVFKGEPNEDFKLQGLTMGGMEMTAWAEGHQLREKDKLEEFIRSVAHGEIDYPEDAAVTLMHEMGWR